MTEARVPGLSIAVAAAMPRRSGRWLRTTASGRHTQREQQPAAPHPLADQPTVWRLTVMHCAPRDAEELAVVAAPLRTVTRLAHGGPVARTRQGRNARARHHLPLRGDQS